VSDVAVYIASEMHVVSLGCEIPGFSGEPFRLATHILLFILSSLQGRVI
jgi:hypothetical protein